MFALRLRHLTGSNRLCFEMLRVAVLLLSGLIVSTNPQPCFAQNLFQRWQPKPKPAKLAAVKVGRFIFATDTPYENSAATAKDLYQVEKQLSSDLGVTPSAELVRIYLFSTHKAFAQYVRTHIPYLQASDTHRNGLFLLRNGVPYIFAVRTPELTTTLRHEYVHVLLNQWVSGEMPLWLDEGLAQYYACHDRDGWNPRAARILQTGPVHMQRSSLSTLERLQTMPQMTSVLYAESWCWVHFLMHSKTGKIVVKEYLSERQTRQDAPSISRRFGHHLAAWNQACSRHFQAKVQYLSAGVR